jgi:hypothetical protein
METFSACKNYTHQGQNKPMLKESPSLKFVFCSAGYDTPQKRNSNFPAKIESEFKIKLGYETRFHIGVDS